MDQQTFDQTIRAMKKQHCWPDWKIIIKLLYREFKQKGDMWVSVFNLRSPLQKRQINNERMKFNWSLKEYIKNHKAMPSTEQFM